MKGLRDNEGVMEFDVKVYLLKQQLTEMARPLVEKGKLQKRFLVDLDALTGDVLIAKLLDRYVADLGTLLNAIISMKKASIRRYLEYINYISKGWDVPDGAILFIAEGDIDPGKFSASPDDLNIKFYSFSLDEFSLVNHLLRSTELHYNSLKQEGDIA